MNDSLRRVTENFGWLLFEKVIKMSIGLVVTILITRQLGIEKYGTYNYILAIAAIFAPLATMGLDAVTIRSLIRLPKQANSILGTALVVRLAGGLLVLLFSAFVSIVLLNKRGDVSSLICLAASGYIFQAFDVIDYYFQSKQKMKRSVVARSAAFLLVNGLKVVALIKQSDLPVFIWLFQLEFVFCCIFYLFNYGKGVTKWSFDKKMVGWLLKDSWPTLIISLSIGGQAYVDQIMLGSMIGYAELSQYSVALTLVNAFSFIPMIVYAATSPEIIQAKEQSQALYESKLKRVYRLMFFLFVATAVPLMLFSDQLIQLLYKNEFDKAGLYLSLFSVRLLFVFIGTVKRLYIVSENMFRFQLIASLIGIGVNVGLNYWLIPIYSSIGAFISILVSYSLTVFFIDLFSAKMRFNLRLIFQSLRWTAK